MNMKFEFEKTGIEGLQIIHPFIVCDERGYFMKTFEASEFKKHGIEFENAEDITSFSHKGVLRGVHFQTRHSQEKLVRVLHGEAWDVAVDLRENSPTYGEWRGFYLSEENKLSVYIPSGFAHGFLALSDDVIFSYRCGHLYEPLYDTGILWNDKDLGIDWPLDKVDKLIISEKDQKLQSFQNFQRNYGGFNSYFSKR